ncbi:MAG TPA: gamma-butyrobetaine hydroxylase-like domain-containing protein [Ramlibacter sp.]|nr:gamma-butyrobetaine hydroxylase-like domain-containing protein [Ramlibacter sp.]
MNSPVWPLDVVLHEASGRLDVLWNDGLLGRLSAPVLRASCRCSQCESLRRGGNPPVAAADLALTSLQPIGEFGLQLCFGDGHDRGIYPWPYLRELSTTPSLGTSP